MYPLTETAVQSLTAGALVITVISYLAIAAWDARRRGVKPRPDQFLRFTKGISGTDLRKTFMASSFSLASAIYVYVEWAAYDGLFALWSPITWFLGVGALWLLSKRVFAASQKTWTLHSYLGQEYGEDSTDRGLVRLSSAVTSLVFFLQIAAEVVVGMAVLKGFLGPGASILSLSLVVGVVFIGYSLIGGLPSVLITDNIQYRLVAVTVIVAFVVGMDRGGATALESIRSSVATLVPLSGGQIVTILSLVALNLPLLITDMSVWQRYGATATESEARDGTGAFAWELLIWMSAIVCFGVGLSTVTTVLPDTRPAVALISYFSDSLVFPLLIAGFMGALVSTADTFLLSSVQTVIVDWKYRDELVAAKYDAQNLSDQVNSKILRDSRLGVLLFGFLAVLVGVMAWTYLSMLLEFLFVVFALQTSLAPSVVWALLGRATGREADAAKASIGSGLAVGIVGLVLAMSGVAIGGISIGLWTPIFSLAISTAVFFTFRSVNGKS